jgi:hypothetical protein
MVLLVINSHITCATGCTDHTYSKIRAMFEEKNPSNCENEIFLQDNEIFFIKKVS